MTDFPFWSLAWSCLCFHPPPRTLACLTLCHSVTLDSGLSLMSVRALCFSLLCVIYSHLNASHVSPQPSAPLCSPICLVSTSSWLCTCHLDALGSGLFKCVSLAVQHRLSELDFHRVSCRRELLYIIDEFYTCLRLAILKHTDLI